MSGWHRIDAEKPEQGKLVYVYGTFIEGLYVLNRDQWYSRDEVESNDEYYEDEGYDLDAVVVWRDKPHVPKKYLK